MNNEVIKLEDIQRIINKTGVSRENIALILQEIQKKYNYLPYKALEILINITKISPSIVLGVATFYSGFRLKVAGKHNIKVCIGTACHVKGANEIYDSFRRYLEIKDDEDTDKDKLFTVSKVACLGCCMLAPAVQIDDVIYGHVNSNSIPTILSDFLKTIINKKDKINFTNIRDKALGIVKICLCSSCLASGSQSIFDEIGRLIKEESLNVELKSVACSGISFESPLIEIEMSNGNCFRYGLVKNDDIYKILLQHFKSTLLIPKIKEKIYSVFDKFQDLEEIEPITRYVANIRDEFQDEYLKYQKYIVMKNNLEINPLSIDEYILKDGFKAFKKCIKEFKVEDIIYILEQSNLRGRGGAGFETSKKWINVKNSKANKKYLICNADEGDPGAFMDRMLLESFPFRVIEGMCIAAYTLNIQTGFIFIRTEYPLAIERIKEALKICFMKGYLGDNILGSKFKFNIKVIESSGAFVCGEETALISCIEGKRGNPHFRPPYPSTKGLWGYPTLLNNVETFSNIAWIILNGSGAFKQFGVKNSRGTKAFALAGKVKKGGLIEVEMGITIKDIVYKIGGGIKDDKKLKAIQIGGPSGGCIPEKLISTNIDFDSLKDLGAIMGSGGLIVLDEDDCMVDVAKYFMQFTMNESCGKCTFCRIGTKRMFEILEKICEGKSSGEDDLNKLEILAENIKQNSLCGLGKSAPNPVLTALRYFKSEFEMHIQGKCLAKKCKPLMKYNISDKCIGCTKCAQNCPVNAIPFNPYFKHEIDQSKCIKCDTCRIICPNDAIIKEDI